MVQLYFLEQDADEAVEALTHAKHVGGKMFVEAVQLASYAWTVWHAGAETSDTARRLSPEAVRLGYDIFCKKFAEAQLCLAQADANYMKYAKPYRPTHVNHPVAVWVAACSSHYDCVLQHAVALEERFSAKYRLAGPKAGERHITGWTLDVLQAMQVPNWVPSQVEPQRLFDFMSESDAVKKSGLPPLLPTVRPPIGCSCAVASFLWDDAPDLWASLKERREAEVKMSDFEWSTSLDCVELFKTYYDAKCRAIARKEASKRKRE